MYVVRYIYLSLALRRLVMIKGPIDISDPLRLLYFAKKMSEHRYDIRISESYVDPNP